MKLDDLLDKFNLISRADGLIWSISTLLPHRRSHKGRQAGPWRIDPGVREIHIDRMHSTGGAAERLLREAHIPIAGRRITADEAIFLVRARQARIAEYRLLRAGFTFGPRHRWIDPRNVQWAARHQAKMPVWGK